MDAARLRGIIDELRKELRDIQYAMHVLESLAAGKPRRGRPPKIVTERYGRPPAAKKLRR